MRYATLHVHYIIHCMRAWYNQTLCYVCVCRSVYSTYTAALPIHKQFKQHADFDRCNSYVLQFIKQERRRKKKNNFDTWEYGLQFDNH